MLADRPQKRHVRLDLQVMHPAVDVEFRHEVPLRVSFPMKISLLPGRRRASVETDWAPANIPNDCKV
jgi:hypothetical protein